MDVDAGTVDSAEPTAGDPPGGGTSAAADAVGKGTDESATAVPTAGRAWFPTFTRTAEVTAVFFCAFETLNTHTATTAHAQKH